MRDSLPTGASDDPRRWHAILASLEESVREAQAALERERRRARLLADVSRSLAQSFEQRPERRLQAVADRIAPELADWCLVDGPDETGPDRFVRLGLAHPDAADAALLDRLGRPGSRVQVRSDPPGLVTRSTEGGAWGRRNLLRLLGGDSLIGAPLLARGKLLGALTLVRVGHRPHLLPADLELAVQLADRGAAALDCVCLHREAQEALHVRDEFMSIASHELKTPLTPLQLQIHTLEKRTRDLVRDDSSGIWLEDHLATIRRQSDRLDRLVGELLDMSRLMHGRLHLELERVDLREVTRAAVADFAGRTDLPRSEVRVEIAPGIMGHWDRLRLEQVISHLLSNALKYGQGQPITIEGRVAGGQALFTVEDHGIGIAPADQDRVFGRFERAVPSRHYGGFGLGLFIARQVVEALGGMITISSEPGKGAAFTVSLPLAGPRPGAPATGGVT